MQVPVCLQAGFGLSCAANYLLHTTARPLLTVMLLLSWLLLLSLLLLPPLRWNEECRIVQEAREMQQTAMTAPGALLYDIVVGAHVPVEGLDAFMLGETGRLIIKTTPLQRMEMFVQELVRRNDSVHLPFWQKFVGDLREQGDASQLQGDASG